MGAIDNYVKAVGVGECAGVVIDLVATLPSKDKLTYAQEAYEESKWSDAIYQYAGFVNGAKALLLAENQNKSPSRNHRFI
jgi:sulfite reductase (ferredoxin)